MFITLTSDQIATVRHAAYVGGRFAHTVGSDVELTTIAEVAIANEPSLTFTGLHIEAVETGYVSCGMVADALNEIIRLDTERRMQAEHEAAVARKEAQRRRQGRCLCCNRKLADATSITLGIGPECRQHIAMTGGE